jgi:superfamily II DNA helicase RecQ
MTLGLHVQESTLSVSRAPLPLPTTEIVERNVLSSTASFGTTTTTEANGLSVSDVQLLVEGTMRRIEDKKVETKVGKYRKTVVQRKCESWEQLIEYLYILTVANTAQVWKALKKYFNNKEARFSCVEQAHAMMEVLKRESDLLVVLPTGCGKSLLFMLPTLVETGMTTVVIVPLVALTGDMKRRCNQAKIKWTEWKGTVHTAQNSYYVVHD